MPAKQKTPVVPKPSTSLVRRARKMHRVLAENAEVRERRNQLRHPAYARPELLATAPNELWSWDITKLLGPTKWTYYYLYVILDVFSRYVVGWMVAHRESAALAEKLIAATCERERIEPGQLMLHADRGSSMTSKPVALLLADLGVTKTHSRPHVSDVTVRDTEPDACGGRRAAVPLAAAIAREYDARSASGWIGAAGRRSVAYDGVTGPEAVLPAMWEELGDAIVRVVADAEEHVREVDLRIDIVPLA